MNAPINPLREIETLARQYRSTRDVLTERATALSDELEAAKRRSLRGLRNASAEVTQAHAALCAAIEAHPYLFESPRTATFHGIRLGYRKGKGRIDWDEDAQVVKQIRRHFPDQADALIKVTETPIKAALNNLTSAELKRLGVTVESTGDVVFVADTTTEVDKLVRALLKGAQEEVSA